MRNLSIFMCLFFMVSTQADNHTKAEQEVAKAFAEYFDARSSQDWDTVAAMETGVLWGYVGMIEGLLRRLREEQGGTMRLPAIATGGLASLFADHLPDIDAVDPDLTIRGLFEIYARNRGARRAVGN